MKEMFHMNEDNNDSLEQTAILLSNVSGMPYDESLKSLETVLGAFALDKIIDMKA